MCHQHVVVLPNRKWIVCRTVLVCGDRVRLRSCGDVAERLPAGARCWADIAYRDVLAHYVTLARVCIEIANF